MKLRCILNASRELLFIDNYNNIFSAYFPYRIEVRQEKNLTPFLFALFLPDLESFLTTIYNY